MLQSESEMGKKPVLFRTWWPCYDDQPLAVKFESFFHFRAVLSEAVSSRGSIQPTGLT